MTRPFDRRWQKTSCQKELNGKTAADVAAEKGAAP